MTADISIPSGAIKSQSGSWTKAPLPVISIPSGAIKSTVTKWIRMSYSLFQFLLVRLKEQVVGGDQ